MNTGLSPIGGASLPVKLPQTRGILRWVYVGRVAVALVVFVAAALVLRTTDPGTLLILSIAAVASLLFTAGSVWVTHVRGVEPGLTFLYAQALFDLALVTTIVHVTEGSESQFPALYILVIAVSAILMPFASSLLVTSLGSLLYLADLVWLQQPLQVSLSVWLQIAVFVAVFVVTGLIASRVRVVGVERELLRREVRRLRLEAGDILRNIQSGVLTADADLRLVYANPAALRLLGLDDRDFVGQSVARVLSARAPVLHRAMEFALTHRLKIYRAEGAVTLPDRSFPIGVTATTIALDGSEPSVTAIFTDISDQKRLEEMHLRTERLEAVAELSASLAHEIKNPLASIRSAIEQIVAPGKSGEDERLLAQLVVRESDRLSRLLSEFLDFSRVQVRSPRALDLGRVAESAVELVRQHPECPPSVRIEVLRERAAVDGDEDLLHRVVMNLVLNAVQACGASAEVTVTVRPVSAAELPPGVSFGRGVELRVADNGPGIPVELRERLFDPFVSGRAGGSGLGLAVVLRAVEAHRGVVLVDSAPGRGAVFRVLFPSGGAQEQAG